MKSELEKGEGLKKIQHRLRNIGFSKYVSDTSITPSIGRLLDSLYSEDVNSHASDVKLSDISNSIGQDVINATKHKEILVSVFGGAVTK